MGSLTPAQERTLAALRRPVELPDFEGVGEALDGALTMRVSALAERWDRTGASAPLRLTKWHLAGCERRRAWDKTQFAWNPQNAEGTMLGQMVQLWLFDPALRPGEAWTRAVDMVRRDQASIGRWIEGVAVGDWVEMRLRCESALVQFAEVFPPLGRDSRPSVEATQQWSTGSVVVTGKVDVQLGADDGTRAGVVFVELKRRRIAVETMGELRLYALLRAARIGTPPRALAAMTIADGHLNVEQVTEEMLWTQVDRLVTSIERVVSLAEGREPEASPGPPCRWCSVPKERCQPGRVWLAEDEVTS